tara:strand:- start:4776 stop:5294 length:519 start_codon:yes stop_codon:yes gene_type:complete
MYKVTAYFRDYKVVQKFYDLYDAIDFRDSADANYPKEVKFEKVKDMREWIYDCWNHVMNAEVNPLRNIPDLQVRHMVMQILAFMWSAVFALLITDSIMAFGLSAIGHVMLIAAVVVTVGTFKVAENKPSMFEFRKDGYHSHGRGRTYTIYRDKKGNAHKVELPPGDPGGEHE